MLMTRPGLTAQAERILEAVEASAGQWIGRKVIAERLEKKVLNGGDIALLEMLVALGYIEAQEVDTRAPSGVRMEYRSK